MIDFSNVKSIVIPEGEVSMIARGEEILWRKQKYKRELLYLESTGTQWIDTMVMGTRNTAYTIVVQATKGVAPVTSVVFGSRSSASANNISTLFGTENGDVYTQDFGNYSTTRLQASASNFTNKVEIHNSYNLRYLKDLETGAYTQATSVWSRDFTTPSNLLLGAKSTGYIAAMTNFCGRFYFCQIVETGVLIRDFTPVLDWDDVPCMYDKVSDALFYNQGTGDFLYG